MSARIVTSHMQEVAIGKDKQTRYGIPIFVGSCILLEGLLILGGAILQPGVPVIPYLTVQKSYEIRDEIQKKAGFSVQWET